MKLQRNEIKFEPVTLIIETQQELNILSEALHKQASRGGNIASEMADMFDEFFEV